jgi:hypothetical protein
LGLGFGFGSGFGSGLGVELGLGVGLGLGLGRACGSRPCMMSTTRMAMSHRLDPRERRLEKDSCLVRVRVRVGG